MLKKAYTAKDHEDQIYKKWEDSGAFTPKADPKKKSFTISMPPPNATGTLHLGHSIMLAIEDIMIRFKRMQGYEALWLPGTDHAAIATQNKVEKLLAEKGQDRHKLGREKFLKEVREFVASSQSTIRNQIRKMGSSCDWTRERYTLDEGLSKAVMTVFKRMHEDGLIYRGNRLVNWCPRCESTLADDEVEHKDVQGHFYHIKYPLKNGEGYIEIATTRPETMLADTAIAVHPKDKRFKKLIGETVILPLVGREIPIIADDYVDIELGTGALKITPAHDPNDFKIGQRHNLETINIFNENGTLNEDAGKKYANLDRFEARKKVVTDLESTEALVKTEDHMHPVGHCYRCGTMIEPFISLQWFIDVNKPAIDGKSLKEKSIEVVKNGSIEILPDRFSKTYYHWMENLHDWCISRQIWWGHRIPVWYCQDCQEVIVEVETPEACKCGNKKLKQDEDTLDTWFSSALWTFSTLGFPEETDDLKFFHPTAVMETGYDILFFWIARMILMTTYALDEVPFKTVYLHGLIRTKDGEKMSKSKPETCIDPLDMIDKYGADALRLSLVIGSTPGNDTRLYEEKIASYRNFVNKIWNSARYVLMNIEEEDYQATAEDVLATNLSKTDKWILTRLNEVVESTTKKLEKYALSDAGNEIYEFMWGEFCDWSLEMSKVKKNPKVLAYVLKNILILLHPFVPFVTEVLWGNLGQKELIITAPWPVVNKNLNFPAEKDEVEVVKNVIMEVRSLRTKINVDAAKKIHVILDPPERHRSLIKEKSEIIKRLANAGELEIKKMTRVKNCFPGVVNEIGIYLPLEGLIDKAHLNKKIDNLKNFLETLEKKLSNKGFTDNAPKEVLEKEKKKRDEVLADLKEIEKQLDAIG